MLAVIALALGVLRDEAARPELAATARPEQGS